MKHVGPIPSMPNLVMKRDTGIIYINAVVLLLLRSSLFIVL